ncbi:mevalonate kinase [Bdellovibrio bacteriovorus W]|nr:mevalonate kinase [Bdellovibrio bacteriovorus W]
MSTDFECRSFGKWILAGEHSVLRGVPALVFPIQSREMHLQYTRTNEPLRFDLLGAHGEELQLLVWGVLDKACDLLKIKKSDLQGTVVLSSTVPVGAGMGASAALCVALTRWLGYLGHVSESEFYDFARNLENLFHGESSGVDIAVALSGSGLHFERHGERLSLTTSWQPQWYISYCGERGVTLDAVNKVKALIASNEELGSALDQQMHDAVLMAKKALAKTESEGFSELVKAIDLAGDCFEKWDLNRGAPEKHMMWLKSQGAVAVKPTGSGGGGYVLSLWKQAPPSEVLNQLIPC